MGDAGESESLLSRAIIRSCVADGELLHNRVLLPERGRTSHGMRDNPPMKRANLQGRDFYATWAQHYDGSVLFLLAQGGVSRILTYSTSLAQGEA